MTERVRRTCTPNVSASSPNINLDPRRASSEWPTRATQGCHWNGRTLHAFTIDQHSACWSHRRDHWCHWGPECEKGCSVGVNTGSEGGFTALLTVQTDSRMIWNGFAMGRIPQDSNTVTSSSFEQEYTCCSMACEEFRRTGSSKTVHRLFLGVFLSCSSTYAHHLGLCVSAARSTRMP